MLKFLIILFLVFYLVYKFGGFLLKGLFSTNEAGKKDKEFKRERSSKFKPSDGNVNVDYVPREGSKKPGNYKGGEYVDYEDVEE